MSEVLVYLIPLAVVGVVAALVLGLISFTQEGEAARRRSNVMMRWRIGLQFAAVMLILLYVALNNA